MSGRAVRLRVDPQVVGTRVGEEAVLVHLDSDRILSLNETGARIWELIAEGRDLQGVRAHLLAEFDAEPETLTAELERFVAALRAHAVVRADDEPEPE